MERKFFLNDRLTNEEISKFKLFDDEELIFASREHWLPMSLRLIRMIFIGMLFAIGFAFVFIAGLHSPPLAINSFLLVLLLTNSMIVRELIHWCFHLYIATNKQIIEVRYSPLLSHAINSVLLDQIRCTEIDVEMFGILPELIGIGNVELTFDRPTHKEEFVIRSIRSPRVIANMLSAQIHQAIPNSQNLPQKSVQNLLWIKEMKKDKYRFIGDSNYGYPVN